MMKITALALADYDIVTMELNPNFRIWVLQPGEFQIADEVLLKKPLLDYDRKALEHKRSRWPNPISIRGLLLFVSGRAKGWL